MITSACNLMYETKDYGPFRLIDAASRLIDILSENGLSSPELEKIRDHIEQGKFSIMNEKTEFYSFLNELVLYITSLIQDEN